MASLRRTKKLFLGMVSSLPTLDTLEVGDADLNVLFIRFLFGVS